MALPLVPYGMQGGPDVLGVPALISQYLNKVAVNAAINGIRPFVLGIPVLSDPYFDSNITIEDQAWRGVMLWQGGDYLVLQVTDIYCRAIAGTSATIGYGTCEFVSSGVIGNQAYGTVVPLVGATLSATTVATLPAQLDCSNGTLLDPCNAATSETYDIPGLYVACMALPPRRGQRNSPRPYYACALATGYPASPTNTHDIVRGVGAALSASGLSPAGAHSQFYYNPTTSCPPQHFRKGE